MNDTFYFIGNTEENIGGKKFICIRILDYEKFLTFKIYKIYNEDLKSYIITNYDLFQNVTDKIVFDIKRDNKTNKSKIVLDINL